MGMTVTEGIIHRKQSLRLPSFRKKPEDRTNQRRKREMRPEVRHRSRSGGPEPMTQAFAKGGLDE